MLRTSAPLIGALDGIHPSFVAPNSLWRIDFGLPIINTWYLTTGNRSMVIVLGTIKMASEHEARRVRSGLITRAKKSRADAGNLEYVFSLNVEDPTEVCLTEVWETDELLKAHLAIPDAEFSTMLATAKIERARVVAYDGSNERVLMSR